MAAAGKDLFTLALAQHRATHAHRHDGEERTVVFVGSKGGGKSSLLLRFLDRSHDTPKPTTALEYTFGRKGRGHDLTKDLVHIWELGGGHSLAKLVDSPVSAATIKTLSFVLVLDLSRPAALWHTMEVLLKAVRARVDAVLDELKQRDSRVPGSLLKKAWSKFGDDHPDKALVNPCPVPLIILGSKYDLFQNFEPEKRKIVCRTLRFVAHTHGASLIFTSNKDEGLLSKTKAVLSYLAFRAGSPSRSVCVDHSKPLVVPAGSDSLAEIGAPAVPKELTPTSTSSARSPLALWHGAFVGFFPADQADEQLEADDPAARPKFAEAAVDAVRKQRDEELQRYRRQAERRERDLHPPSNPSADHRSSSSGRERRGDRDAGSSKEHRDPSRKRRSHQKSSRPKPGLEP